jgi:hemoglobin
MLRRLLLAVLLGASLGCGAPPWREATLYDDLGAEAGIARIVSAFLDRLAGDARIAHFFDQTNLDRFERLLSEHFCQIADGPCRYSGDSMNDVHRGLGIREADFDALVEDLQLAMDHVGISYAVQFRLLARLAPLRREIVEGDPCGPFAWSRESRTRCAAREALRGP